MATQICNMRDIYNVNITIKATKCDGVLECVFGEDETDCSLPDWISYTILGTALVISPIIAWIMWQFTIKDLQKIYFEHKFSKEDFEFLHGTEALKAKMQQIQGSIHSVSLNKAYVEHELEVHDGVYSEAICCIKVKN